MNMHAGCLGLVTWLLPISAYADQSDRRFLSRFIDPVSIIEQKSGFYIGPRTRISALEDTEFSSKLTKLESAYDVGFSGSGTAGYAFVLQNVPIGVRGELELGYASSNVNTVTLDGVTRPESDSVGTLTSLTGFTSGYLDLHLGRVSRFSNSFVGRLSPFAGAGIGYSRVSLDEQGSFSDGMIIDDSTNAPAFHVSAGLTLSISEKTRVEVGYRYEEIFDAEFSASNGSSSSLDIERQSFTFGIRRLF